MSDVQQTTNQPSATQPKLTKKERHSAILRYMAMGVNNLTTKRSRGHPLFGHFQRFCGKFIPMMMSMSLLWTIILNTSIRPLQWLA